MNKIYLCAFLVAVVSANSAIDLNNVSVPGDNFKCFAKKFVNKVVIQISDERGNTNVDFLTHYTNAKTAGISSVDATVIINDSFNAVSISTKVANALPSGFNGIVWLRVDGSSPGLWTKAMALRIPYLLELVAAFTARNLKVGISSDMSSWISVFGQRKAGTETLNSTPVWYVGQDALTNFNDWNTYGFGTWTEPTQKNWQSYVTLCDTRILSLNYYEGDIQIHQ